MSLLVPVGLLRSTSDPALAHFCAQIHERFEDDAELEVDNASLSDDALVVLDRAASEANAPKLQRTVEAIRQARAGAFGKPVPNFKAFQGVLEAYLRADQLDCWIYVRKDDGQLYPQLVTGISYDSGMSYSRKDRPQVQLSCAFYGASSGDRKADVLRVHTVTYSFRAENCARRRIADALKAYGIYKETPELRAAFDASVERFHDGVRTAFAKQFRMNGVPLYEPGVSYGMHGQELSNRAVIHDVEPDEYDISPHFIESELLPKSQEVGLVPAHPVVRVFDLKRHEFFWTHADLLEPYRYDKSLRDKLVLPATHRDLLDVLTSNLDAFLPDVIEGKSAGNVILCVGVPGVGKTLTAEVYAQLSEKPLYAVHTGLLGATASDVESNLETVLERANRWGAVALIDECDVLVAKRGNDLMQNAVCAVLLRTLEYHHGLVFMTSNRGRDIDDAFLSRCAAIIEYPLASPEDARRIWNVLAAHFGAQLPPALVDELVHLFPKIAPRDIKMLLRLALRVSAATREQLTLDIFRRSAMFRAIEMRESATA